MRFERDEEGAVRSSIRRRREHMIVRRHINWNTQRPDLREALVHLVGYIKRHFCGIASAGPSLF